MEVQEAELGQSTAISSVRISKSKLTALQVEQDGKNNNGLSITKNN